LTASQVSLRSQPAFLAKRQKRCYSHSIGSQEHDACPEPVLHQPAAGCRHRPSLLVGTLHLCGDEAPTEETLETQFSEVSMHFHMLLHQTCIVMNDVIARIRAHHLQDSSRLAQGRNFEVLTEVSYGVATSTYFFSKWCHEMEPKRHRALSKPSKPVDWDVTDLLAHMNSALSKMEEHGSKLVSMLMRILKIARLAQQEGDSTCSVRDLAQSRGLSVDEFSGIAMHLDHLLSVTQGLARSLDSGDRPRTAPSLAGAARVAAKHKISLSRSGSSVSTSTGSLLSSRCVSPEPSEPASPCI